MENQREGYMDKEEERALWNIVRSNQSEIIRHDERVKTMESLTDDLKKGQRAVEMKIDKLLLKIIAGTTGIMGAIQVIGIIWLKMGQ